MASVYVSEQTKQKLFQFINRSRVSPEFGSPKKLKSFDHAIDMLLDFALRYEFEVFENLCKIPLVQGEMSEETFENEEVRNQIINKQLEEIESNDSG